MMPNREQLIYGNLMCIDFLLTHLRHSLNGSLFNEPKFTSYFSSMQNHVEILREEMVRHFDVREGSVNDNN